MYSYHRTIPSFAPDASRIIVIPDVHRDVKKAVSCFRLAGLIDDGGAWVGGSTVVVQVGDQVDGGHRNPADEPPHECGRANKEDVAVLKFFNKMHGKASAEGGAVYSLMGNHEMMNVLGDFSYAGLQGCGKCAADRKKLFSPGGYAARIIGTTRNVGLKVGRVVFVHAGFVPVHIKAAGLENINRLAADVCVGNETRPVQRDLLLRLTMQMDGALMNRLYSPGRHVSANDMDTVLRELDADHMIVGHNAHQPGITPLHGGRVWVVDPGMSKSVMNGMAGVLEITSRERSRAPGYSFRVLYLK